MIKIISTDFDGTLFNEFEAPPIPVPLQELIARLQKQGVKWVINTGRDLPFLMHGLMRPDITIQPDYVIIVEREIHRREDSGYIGHAEWNDACRQSHEELFVQVRKDLPRLLSWVSSRYNASISEDAYSPFCLTAGNNTEADAIHEYMEDYCREVPHLKVMRNSVYARFCHADYDKGTALTEIARLHKISPKHVFAVGDHLNDLPMLELRHAACLAAPANALDVVKQAVLAQNGFVSSLPNGYGVADGLNFYLRKPVASSS
ncbi:MAG TPA: HAD-IIB family hydrolase [Verrucomicrobiae bacterium]|nr:HAD-IIB family hydrolase [Verrucomicrobiae bacterium]